MLSKEMMGKKIKEARENFSKKLGFPFTQADLAKKAGLSRGYINSLETGDSYPSVPKLQKIAEACEVKMSWFDEEPVVELTKELKELGVDYISVVKELKDKGYRPEEIRRIIELADALRK